jgi:hypothetical protein
VSITAGTSKSFADPFLPATEADALRIRSILTPMHENFIAWVRSRRGGRLNAEADLFNADIWVGQAAAELGLVDGVAHLKPKLTELYGKTLRLVPMGPRRGLFRRLGLSLGETAWARWRNARTGRATGSRCWSRWSSSSCWRWLLVGMLGKLLFPRRRPRLRKDRPAVCPNCGRR